MFSYEEFATATGMNATLQLVFSKGVSPEALLVLERFLHVFVGALTNMRRPTRKELLSDFVYDLNNLSKEGRL